MSADSLAQHKSAVTDLPDSVQPLLRVLGADIEVPLLDGSTVRQANLDLAASAPALASVADYVNRILPYYSSVHRGIGHLSDITTELYDQARNVVAKLLGARADDEVIFTKSTTDSTNLLATCVPGETVVLDIEHHANLLPWRERRVVLAADTIADTLSILETELARKPAALLAITGASNITGELMPLTELATLAHRYGARLAVDGAQLIPHRTLNLSQSGVDFLVFSGHKLYAPFGAGVLIGSADWLDAAKPYLAGGGAVADVKLDSIKWTSGYSRHEAGSPNVIGVAALAFALERLTELNQTERHEHELALTTHLRGGVAQIPGVQLLVGFLDAADRLGIATLEIEKGSVGLLAVALAAEYGVSVRAGRFCAHPYFDRLATRGNGLRASVGVGTASDDVDRFLYGLRKLVTEGPAYQYLRTDKGWLPAEDTRPILQF